MVIPGPQGIQGATGIGFGFFMELVDSPEDLPMMPPGGTPSPLTMLPFFLANGTKQNVAFNNAGNLPFFIASGTEEDVPATTANPLPQALGTGDSPTFTGETLAGLTASRVVMTDGGKQLVSGANTDAQLSAMVTAGSGEGHITILPWFYSGITQGTWPITVSTDRLMNGQTYNSSNAQNDQIDYLVFLAVGTYTLTFMGEIGNNRAIVTLLVDGSSAGTVDFYHNGYVPNTLLSITGISITTAGLKTISLKAATRNASCNGWQIAISSMALYRTA
jgi:hypothetical protein